jgi:hypothetical protein
MPAKLIAIAVFIAAGAAVPLAPSLAATVQWPPPPLPGVGVNVIYPSVAVDTPLYRFVGDDHRQITFRVTETISYRFVYDDPHYIRIYALNPA